MLSQRAALAANSNLNVSSIRARYTAQEPQSLPNDQRKNLEVLFMRFVLLLPRFVAFGALFSFAATALAVAHGPFSSPSAGGAVSPHSDRAPQPDFSSSAIITTFAGDHTPGLGGDGGPATSANLDVPSGVVSDSKGNIYTTDNLPYEAGVRRIDATTGIITTYAGGNSFSDCSPYPACTNGILATKAVVHPFFLAVDSADNLYISDGQVSIVWKVDAKTQIITIYAGTGQCGSGDTCYSGDGGPATKAQLNVPTGMAFDASNNLYLSDYENAVIRVVKASTGVIETLAGSASANFSGPLGLAFDMHGNLLVVDAGKVDRYDASNTSFTVLAGEGSGCTGETDPEGDGCPASDAVLGTPYGIAVDAAGNIFVSDDQTDNIRVIDAVTGVITVAAGTGKSGYSGDNGSALDAELDEPQQIAFAPSGNLFLADVLNEVVREIHYGGAVKPTAATPVFSPAPGKFATTQRVSITDSTANATIYYTTDGATPTTSSHEYGGSITVSETTTIKAIATRAGYTQSAVATGTYTIQPLISTVTTLTGSPNPAVYDEPVKFAIEVKPGSGTAVPTGVIATTIDGAAGPSLTLSAGAATFSSSSLAVGSHTVAARYEGNSAFAGSSATLVERIVISGTPAKIIAVSGSGQASPVGKAFAAPLVALVEDAKGNPVSGATVNFAGKDLSFTSPKATTNTKGLASATAAPTAAGSLTAAAATAGVTGTAAFALTGTPPPPPPAPGIISTYAGTGTNGFSGDGGPAVGAEINNPVGEAMDTAGNFYFADLNNNRIRKITPLGIISTFAGNGTAGFSGDGGAATKAELSAPLGIAFDPAGNLYIADSGNQRVRKVTPGGIVSTVAGNGAQGYNGDGIAAIKAELAHPNGIATDSKGNLYIADGYNQRIRMVNTAGIISTVAGNGTAGYSGDAGPAKLAELNSPAGVALDSGGNLFIADDNNARVRKVNSAGAIATYAGTGYGGYNGDGIAATSAELYAPDKVATDSAGNVYISEYGNNRIRKVTTDGIISTVAGTGVAGYGGDAGLPTKAEIQIPRGIYVDRGGSLYIGDAGNARIRLVQYQAAPPTFSVKTGTYVSAQTVSLADSTRGVTIYYTLNGGTPTTTSTKYSKPIPVNQTTTIKAIAVLANLADSTVASATYTITPPAPKPTFTPAAGTYTSAQTVKLADSAAAGLVIYYTINGTTPTTSSTKYTAAGIKVSATETIKAIAVATGDSESPVAIATYTVK